MSKKSTRIANITVVIKSGDPPIQLTSKDVTRIKTRVRINLPKTPV